MLEKKEALENAAQDPKELLRRIESMIDDYKSIFDVFKKYLKEKGLEDDFTEFLERQ